MVGGDVQQLQTPGEGGVELLEMGDFAIFDHFWPNLPVSPPEFSDKFTSSWGGNQRFSFAVLGNGGSAVSCRSAKVSCPVPCAARSSTRKALEAVEALAGAKSGLRAGLNALLCALILINTYGDSTRWHHRLPKNSKATTCTYILRQRPMHVDLHNMIIYVGILIVPYGVK